MAITVVTDLNNVQDSRDLSWNCGTLATGDIIVVTMATEDVADTMNAPTATGVTFTSRVADVTASHCATYVYTGVVTSGGAKTVSAVRTVSSFFHGGVCTMFPTADGYSLAGSPNLTDTRGSGAPSASITGTSAGNILVAVNADWAAVDGASRTYRGTVTEDGYARPTAVIATHYYWHQTAASGTNTIGLTAPTGQTYTTGGVEVLFAGGAAVPITNLAMAPMTGA